MNMIEKVAQTIREANDAMGGLSSKSDYELAARAAIETIRDEIGTFMDWDEESVVDWLTEQMQAK